MLDMVVLLRLFAVCLAPHQAPQPKMLSLIAVPSLSCTVCSIQKKFPMICLTKYLNQTSPLSSLSLLYNLRQQLRFVLRALQPELLSSCCCSSQPVHAAFWRIKRSSTWRVQSEILTVKEKKTLARPIYLSLSPVRARFFYVFSTLTWYARVGIPLSVLTADP